MIHAVPDGHPNTSRLTEARSTSGERRGIGTSENVSCVLQKLPARACQLDPSFRTMKKRGLEFFLESLNLVRERGLRDVQLCRSVTKMQRLRDCDETSNLLQFHGDSLN
jgi:hypothetical protein